MAEVSTTGDLERALPAAERDLYWALVHRAADVLSDPYKRSDANEKVHRYRELATRAGQGTQARVYHNEPFTVAADLLDVDEGNISREQWEEYLVCKRDLEAGSPIVPFRP